MFLWGVKGGSYSNETRKTGERPQAELPRNLKCHLPATYRAKLQYYMMHLNKEIITRKITSTFWDHWDFFVCLVGVGTGIIELT